MKKNERMEALSNAGINTGKYFTFEVPEGLEPGAKIHLVFDESGVAKFEPVAENNDPILNQIIEDSYVRNTKLHRRFVMAQMFHHLNYVSYDGQYRGYNDCLKRMYSYDYTLKMMLDEVKVLSKLEVRDRECFEERVHFFDKKTVAAVMEDYLVKLKEYVDKLPIHKCKGVPYKKVKGVNIFVSDLDKRLYAPIRGHIMNIKYAKNYAEVYRILTRFLNKRTFVKLPYDTAKSKVWIDAYKGEGSFYTCKNLIMFHGCRVHNKYGVALNLEDSMCILKHNLGAYKGEYYRMFAFMKKLIADNNINTKTHIAEVCNK